MIHDFYQIEGAKNINPKDCYENPKDYPDFQKDYKKVKALIKRLVKNKKAATFLQFCDGEYFFLKKHAYGTATPGYTTLKDKDYSQIDLEPFKKNCVKNDYIFVEIFPEYKQMWKEIFPKRKIDFPAEYLYGLVFNKWFTKTFDGKIGLIGAAPKMNLIKELQKHKEYLDYLGMKKGFVDFIEFPQTGSSDDVKKSEKIVAKQLKKGKADVYLVGIGQAKMAIMNNFKKYRKAVYIDVGAGIDGLAGMVDNKRIFAGDWVNFRIEDYDYSDIHQTYTRYQGQGRHYYLRKEKNDFLSILEKSKSKVEMHYNSLVIYNQLFKKFVNIKVKVLVISSEIENGFTESLKKYLGKVNISVIADKNMNKSDLSRMAEAQGPFDLIIDSGNPVTNRQVNTFIVLFPLLKNPGTYIIEDTFSSYWPKYEGELYGKNSTIEMLKTMVDRINWHAYRSENAGDKKITNELDFFERTISSIHFYENLAIVEKSEKSLPKLYKNGIVEDYKHE